MENLKITNMFTQYKSYILYYNSFNTQICLYNVYTIYKLLIQVDSKMGIKKKHFYMVFMKKMGHFHILLYEEMIFKLPKGKKD